MTEDITKNYKAAVSNVSSQAGAVYQQLSKGGMYLHITTAGKEVYIYARLVSPIASSTATYDITVTGKGIEFTLDENGDIISGSANSSMIATGLLTGTSPSPDDDPIVEIISDKDFESAADMLASFIKNAK